MINHNEILDISGKKNPYLHSCFRFSTQFNRGTSAMQHYVGLLPMFDLEVMNADTRLVLGDPGSQPSPSNVASGLSSLYEEITGLNNTVYLIRVGGNILI